MEKPLFIPLQTEYYLAFQDGSKTEELRQYGPRWNEITCHPGRPALLSKGYGKHSRMIGKVLRFSRIPGALLKYPEHRAAVKAVYGTLDIDVAVISICDLKAV